MAEKDIRLIYVANYSCVNPTNDVQHFVWMCNQEISDVFVVQIQNIVFFIFICFFCFVVQINAKICKLNYSGLRNKQIVLYCISNE